MLTEAHNKLFCNCKFYYETDRGMLSSVISTTHYEASYLLNTFKRYGFKLIKIEVPKNHILRTWKDGQP